MEGSWRQVCARGFGGRDADVACRQLGYGAGTISNGVDGVRAQEGPRPPVGAAFVGCNGSEDALLDCPQEGGLRREFGDRIGCREGSRGLFIGCVAQPVAGAIISVVASNCLRPARPPVAKL